MLNPFNVVIPLCLGFLIVGYALRERSLRKLDTMQADTLMFAIRPLRIRFVLTMAALAVILLAARFAFGRLLPPLAIPALVAVLGSALFFQWAARRALMRAQLPGNFLRMYGVSQLMDLAVYLSLFGTMLVSILLQGHA